MDLCRSRWLASDYSFINRLFDFMQSLQFLLEKCKILVIGAGGLGCELLKNLVGLSTLTELDMLLKNLFSKSLKTVRRVRAALHPARFCLMKGCVLGPVWVSSHSCG